MHVTEYVILKFKVQESIFMNFIKRKESRKHKKTLTHVNTSCKQTTPLIDTEKFFKSGICICVTYDWPKMNKVMVKLVTELYKSTISVVRDFHFPRIVCFLNPSRLACSDNIDVSRKISQIIHVTLWWLF